MTAKTPTNEDGNLQKKEKSIRENEKFLRGQLSRTMSPRGSQAFAIYFLVIMALSCSFLIYYWAHPTIEEKISALNSTITSDIAEKHKIKLELQEKTNSSIALPSENLSQKYSRLIHEINQSRTQMDTYQKETKFLVPLTSTFDFFYLGIVKNFVLVAVSGLFASTIASFRSLYTFYGYRKLRTRWALSYVFRPWQGLLLAIIVYVIIRSGIQAGIGITSDQVAGNLFIVAVTGFLSGLYSDEIYSKFHEIFDTFFKISGQKADALTTTAKYPSTVAELVDSAVFPDEAEVIFYDKGNTANKPQDSTCLGAFAPDQSYWLVKIREGKDGIFWVRDSDQQIVCQYKLSEKEKHGAAPPTPPPEQK